MALLLRRLRPGAAGWARGRHAPGSCEQGAPEPCPPCVPPPRPPCRAPPPTTQPAQRRVCCPPPAGCRPPCAPRDPPCARTCDTHARETQMHKKSMAPANESNQIRMEVEQQRCAFVTDLVANRLAAAKQARRSSYELEVASRKLQPQPELGVYRPPAGEWDRVRATDGHEYSVPCGAKLPGRCGPGRTPPPPTLVHLPPDTACRPHAKPDPCAHRPRVLLQIDRSSDPKKVPQRDHQDATSSSNGEYKKCEPGEKYARASQPGLTERIMRSLTLGRGATKRVDGNTKRVAGECARRRCAPPCAPGARADDDAWCSRLPPPAPAPRACREPSVTERLRRRPGNPRCGGGPIKRKLHTSAHLRNVTGSAGRDMDKVVADTKRDAEKLKGVLEERRALKAAGRGRERVCSDAVRSVGHGAGRLELQLRLDSAVVAAPPQKAIERKSESEGHIEKLPRKSSAPLEPVKKDSWLSIKCLQRKLSNNMKKEAPPPPKSAPICPPPKTPTCPPLPHPVTKPITAPQPSCPPPDPKAKPASKPKPAPPTTSPPCVPRSKPCEPQKPKKVKSTGFTPNMIFIKN